jgi:hypothetical protein
MATDTYATRSAAGTTITRTRVNLDSRQLDVVTSTWVPFRFSNANGADLYFYPGFIVAYESDAQFALIDWKDVAISVHRQRFVEEEEPPHDAPRVGETWQYVNKNGTPDRRFANNRQLPILEYGQITLTTSNGLHEAYHLSNPDRAEQLATLMQSYQSLFE